MLSAEELVGKVSWTRFCTALGSVLALAGAVFLLITLVAMVLVVADDTGLWIMAIAYGLLLVVMAYWTWAYFHRFGSYGILPERTEPEPAPIAPRRPEQSVDEPAFAGPPVPTADDAIHDLSEPAPDEGEVTRDEQDSGTGAIASEPEEEPIAGAVEESDAAITDEAPGSASAPRLETPEERLAHTETPIDHGSAEGELDLAASAHRRPGARTPKRAEPVEAPDTTGSEPAPASDRDRS